MRTATQSLNELIDIAQDWADSDPDPKTKSMTLSLIKARDETQLRACFSRRLAFGTAGLRGALGPGPHRMNRALIRRVSTGLADYLNTSLPLCVQEINVNTPRIIIGYDGRHGSLDFAHEAARVFGSEGFSVYLSSSICPTPLLAYSVIQLNAVAGVMVTASHNPPQDNGFKVYWGNGAQIIPPHDQQISEHIDRAGDCRTRTHLTMSELSTQGLLSELPKEVEDRYLNTLQSLRLYQRLRLDTGSSPLRIAYTAMHGVGYIWFDRLLRACGYQDLYYVEEQIHPDPDFPTVSFPNPEEEGALDLAKVVAQTHNVHLLLAHDPDADRLAVIAQDASGSYRAFTGDQVGVLIAHEMFQLMDVNTDDMVAATIVSSSLLSEMARHQNIQYAETLTGFKWIANRALEHERGGGRFLFGYEEAIGYSLYGVVRDKDGISAALFMADMAARALDEGVTLWDRMAEIYERYGVYMSSLKSRVCSGDQGRLEIEKYMKSLRQDPPRSIGGVEVSEYTDFSQEADPLRGDVLRFSLADGSRVIARPSGTEPKIKFYFEIRESLNESSPKEDEEDESQLNTKRDLLKRAEERGALRLNRLMDAFDELLDG